MIMDGMDSVISSDNGIFITNNSRFDIPFFQNRLCNFDQVI